MEKNLILYDWLSFTAKTANPFFLVELLGLEDAPWEVIKGARGYQERLYFNCISIHYNGREDMGVWCEMSGQGCRAFESLSSLPADKWENLFYSIREYSLNITRLDIAYDDHIGVLDINQLIQDTRHQGYISKSEYWEIIESSKGQTIQFGSPKSDVLIRIYDKARERNCPASEHWIRCELQLRRERAIKFTQLPYAIGERFCGVMVNYLRFVDPDYLDSNKWRWPIKSYWGDFLENAQAIKLYEAPGMEYNLDRCERYVIGQAGNAIEAYIKIRGVDGFLDTLKHRSTRRNPKYDRLVAEYRTFLI